MTWYLRYKSEIFTFLWHHNTIQLLTQVLVNRPDVHIYNSFVVRKYYKHKSTELDCKEHLQVHVLQIQMSLQRMFHVEGVLWCHKKVNISDLLLKRTMAFKIWNLQKYLLKNQGLDWII
jgi:hypothetical protein